ncbi:MAG: BMC domain-containing protein [Candidatus Accumulibacter sp.]|jgi:ethanolamine utilization protein EutK|nr:BMC domain-containing protein [Accumulibacter sp.]
MKIDSFGLIEVRGLVTAIETADAMLKAANVRLIRQHRISPGLITLIVEGDLGACRAAVDAGAAAAARLGEVVGRLEIGRPDGDTETMVLSLLSSSSSSSSSSGGQADERPSAWPDPPPPPADAPNGGTPPSEETAEGGPITEGETAEARAVMLAFIAEFPRGRSWAEITRFFPEYAGHESLLKEMVEEGALRKKGLRYLRSDENRGKDR